MVQKLVAKTKRRAPKKENGEKNMFCGLLCCADCGSPLWFNVDHPNKSIQYFNCSNYRANRGTCPSTHYIRADSLKQVVISAHHSITKEKKQKSCSKQLNTGKKYRVSITQIRYEHSICLWATKKIFSAVLRMNSNSHMKLISSFKDDISAKNHRYLLTNIYVLNIMIYR